MTANTPSPVESALPTGIMIVGAAKSGTTAMFYAVRDTLTKAHGLRVEGLFEPTAAQQVKNYLKDGGDDIPLMKMLMGPFIRKDLGDFDQRGIINKKIIIFRDPRDNIVSRLVFMLPKLIDLSEVVKIEEVMKLLRRKEQDPASLSVVSIIREISRISGRGQLLTTMRNNAVLAARMKRESGSEYFMMPYEDFVEGRFAELNAYLGFEINTQFEVGERHTYVIRTKSSGSWKDWFLAEDIDYFATQVADDYRELGFDVSLEPNAVRVIEPASCSEYAQAQFIRLRQKRDSRRSLRASKDSAETASPTAKAPAKETRLDRKARRQRREQRRRETDPVTATDP